MRLPDIVFNDVSLSHRPVSDIATARAAFESLLSAIGGTIDDRISSSVVRTQCCLQNAYIPTQTGDVWTASDWLDDPKTDREMRLFLLTLDSKVPVENGLKLNEEHDEALMTHEHRVGMPGGPDCYAAGFALYLGDIVASVPTDLLWDVHQLDVYVCTGKSVLKKSTVDHLSREAHCAMLSELVAERHFDSVTTAAEFSANKEKLFPYLRFSPDVDRQVEKLGARHLANALEKLSKMNETARSWLTSNSTTPDYRFQWSPESSSTMERVEFRNKRVFQLPGGGADTFEHHLYLSDRHRIHFIEDRNSRSFIIGYIGDHLPTVRYPH